MYNNADESRDADDENQTPDDPNQRQPLLPIIKHRDAAGFPAEATEVKQETPPAEYEGEDELSPAPKEKQPAQKVRVKKPPELPSIERRNWLIHYHFIRKEWDTCKALIKEQSDESHGACEYASYIKGVILRQEGKLQESLDMFQACAMLNPRNGLYLKQIARSLFLMGKPSSALTVFDESLKVASDDWEIYHWKGVCLYHTGEYGKAKENLKQAIGISKHDETYTLLGKIYSKENDYMNAIDAYKKALELSPEDPELLTTLGLLYLKTGSEQQAFEALGRALAFDPSHAGAIVAAGSMMQQHGDYDVALTKYRVAAAQWPDSAQLWSNIGMCFYGKKKHVAAVSCLKRANYLAPLDWKILYNLGMVELEMRQYASAFHFLSAAININPKVATLYMTLAVALTHLEDYENARQAYEHAIKLDQRDPSIPLNYAVFCYKQDDSAGALNWLNVFYQQLQQVRESKGGTARIDREITEMAEKLSDVLQANKARPQTASSSRRASSQQDGNKANGVSNTNEEEAETSNV